jgi:hypothetical protein
MKKKWKHRKYSGELNKPLEMDYELWAELNLKAKENPVKLMEIEARFKAEFITEFKAKMQLLFDEFKIPRNALDRWERLAGELACAHVRGFGSSNQSGRPGIWTTSRQKMLVFEIRNALFSIALEKKCSPKNVKITDAIRRIVKNDPGEWGRNAPSIHKRYNEAVRGACKGGFPTLAALASLVRPTEK